MRKLILLLTLLPLKVLCLSDSIPKNAEGLYEYTDVVNVDSASAAKLYSNAKLFIVDAFKSGKDVTQLNDENAKTVVGSGTTHIFFKGIMGSAIEKFLSFKIFLQCKEGRYKYTISNFEFIMVGTMVNATIALEDEKRLKHYITKNQVVQLKQQISNNLDILIKDLKNHLSSQTGSTKDW